MSNTNKAVEEAREKIATILVKWYGDHNVDRRMIEHILHLPEIAVLHPDQSLPQWQVLEPKTIFGRGNKKVYEQALQDMLDQNWRRVVKV